MIKSKILLIFLSTICLIACTNSSPESYKNQKDKEAINKSSIDSASAIYRQFFFTGTHNSYAGNLDGMKREGIATQLNSGLRFFEFDLFSYHTDIKLQKSTTGLSDNYLLIEQQDKLYLLTHSTENKTLIVQKINDGNLSFISEISLLTSTPKRFTTLTHQDKTYVLSHDIINGKLSVYLFDSQSLSLISEEDIFVAPTKLNTFVFKNKAYISIRNNDELTYQIYKLSFTGETPLVENKVYETTLASSTQVLEVFPQNEKLYIFKSNPNNIALYTTDVLLTNTTTWQVTESILGSSNLLRGEIGLVHKGDKTYINSYTTNGDVLGNRLVIDQAKPNLIHEYSATNTMLTGAKSSLFPTDQGYYLLLKKDNEIQLSKIIIGDMFLGHDAPGDEVDLSVDNPNSIRLEDWITYMATWSNKNPKHEPLFIMTELKMYKQWLVDAKWQNIIKLMKEKFGDKLRFHNSSGFQTETIVDKNKIVDGKTKYFGDKNTHNGLLGKVILYIQPNNKITKSEETNNFKPFETTNGILQENFLQLKRYRENNKLVSPDWRKPERYGNDIGYYIDRKDDSYISRIFHMQSALGDAQYKNIRCTNVMFAVSDRPYDKGAYQQYITEQKQKNSLTKIASCQ